MTYEGNKLKTTSFALSVFAAFLITVLYIGLTVLFVQQKNLRQDFDAHQINGNEGTNGDRKGGIPTVTEAPTSPTTITPASTRAPITYQPATVCDPSVCKLPECRCAGSDIPGGLALSNTPQMVLFTMDDGINDVNSKIYRQIFDNVRQANGCPVKTTFYVSGDNTDYKLVRERQNKGNEVADHSVSHRFPILWWKQATRRELVKEVVDMKKRLQSRSGARVSGWRNPFLEIKEETFKILYENDFLYDSSLASSASQRWWPYSLEYLPRAPCYLANCPKNSYPGLWEVPLRVWDDGNTGKQCLMFDACKESIKDGKVDSVYNLIMDNFNKHYQDNKAPFPIFGHSPWFDGVDLEYRREGLKKFIREVTKKSDVFFVTVKEVVEWTKNPVGLDRNPFSCSKDDKKTSLPVTTPSGGNKRRVYKPAKACDQSVCKLPNCRCSGSDIPGGLDKSNTPQMVLFTMDDGINSVNLPIYKKIFDGRKNANGCPMRSTYYVSGDNTQYPHVKEMLQRGHEIADHSQTHTYPITYWSQNPSYERIENEIVGQRKKLESTTGAKVVGWRNPYLASTEMTFRVLSDNGFLYDTSVATKPGVRWWPYSLEYLPTIPCPVGNCPKNSYPGLWEMPMNTWACDVSNNKPGAMFDECNKEMGSTADSVYEVFMRNFRLHYNDNRTPFAMFAHSFWMDKPNEQFRLQGMLRFMDEISKMKDVFFVTVKDAIDWTRSPKGLDQKPFSC